MKRNYWGIGAIVLFIAVFAYFAQPLFMPPAQGNVETEPFWVVETTPESLSVFTLTLDDSTLDDLINVLGNRLDLSLFEENGEYQLEGYIRETHVGGITARIPFTLNVSPSQIDETLGLLEAGKKASDTKTVYEIPSDLHHRFYKNTVHSLAFIPMAVSLDETVVLGRFGNNPIKLQEELTGAIHYLYPEKGIDITIDQKGEYRSIVQYIAPNLFEERVLQPLYKNGVKELPLTISQ